MGVDREFFKTQGYFVAKGIVPADLMRKVHGEVHKVVTQQLQFRDLPASPSDDINAIFTDMQTLYKADLQAYLASLRLCAKLCSTFQVILNPNMLEAAKELGIEFPVFQTQPVLHVMSEKLRVQDGYFGVQPHQDWPALHSGLDTITSWIPLTSVRKRKFTLEIAPKTHMLGMVEAKAADHAHEIGPEVLSDIEFKSVEMEPGDVLFFSTFLIHRSELDGDSEAFRLAYSMRYENASDPYFIAKQYPFAQKRVVDRELSPDAIPSREQVRSVFR